MAKKTYKLSGLLIFLLRVGEGREKTYTDDQYNDLIQLPNCISFKKMTELELINATYPDLKKW